MTDTMRRVYPSQLQPVSCSACGVEIRHVERLVERVIPALPDVVELGYPCPGCGAFQHGYYTNARLRQLARDTTLIRKPVEHERLKRKYLRKVEAFQWEIEQRLAEHGQQAAV